MTRRLISLLFSIAALLPARADGDLWERFLNPSNEARTKVWWFHGETETTEAGIDADLEAFKEKGIGGVVFYDQVHGDASGAFPSMSPEWWQMLKYAATKAKQLGLTFEVAASNGYVTGGPWITPELGMRKTAVVDTVISIAKRQEVRIALPYPDAGFHQIATLLFPDSEAFREIRIETGKHTLKDNEPLTLTHDVGRIVEVGAISYLTNPRGKGSTGSMNIPGKPQERYFGAKYIDLPPIGDLEYSLDGKTWKQAAPLTAVESVIGHKSKERTISFPIVRGRWFRIRLHDWVDAEGQFNTLQIEDMRLATRDLIDNWQVKAGLRTEVTYPHPEGGNRGAIAPEDIRDVTGMVDANGMLTLTLEPGTWHILRVGHIPTGGRTKHGRKNLLGLEANVLSEEAATVHYNHYFKPICDTLAAIGCKPQGMCMDSHEAGIQNWTEGFEKRFHRLHGYELTPWLPALAGYIVADRTQTEQVLLDFRKSIAKTIAEAYYGTLAKLCEADGVDFTSQAMLNIDNDNIRSRGRAPKPQGEFWAYQTNGNYDCLDAASSAHLYGRSIASGEAFTDTPYTVTWDELLRIANLAYCRGINEFAVCASTYQPWLDRKYDDSASAHPYVFHRLHPEWDSVGAFWEYQARCAQLLREGVPVVDMCVYLGEDMPLKTFAYKLPVMPEGYNFDVCNYDALLNRFTARNGRLAVEGGMEYGALVVQDRTYLSPEALQKIEALARDGVLVIRCDQGESVAEGFAKAGIRPDLAITSASEPDDRICFFHRRTPDADIYFVYNHSPHAYDAPATLRTAHTHAEAWNPRTATREPMPMSADKQLRFRLQPYQSLFFVVD